MKKPQRVLRSQKGFTLIEIIAVLVILGILAAVAVPKYLDMQSEAQAKAVVGAVAALQSVATMQYSKDLLAGANSASATSWTVPFTTANAVNVGDFQGNLASGTNAGEIVVTVTNAPSGYNLTAGNLATAKTKTFKMY